MATDIFSDGGGAVKREEDGSFELGFGTFGLSFGDVEGEAGPLAEREVNEIVDVGNVLGDQVDTPETRK